MEGMERKKEEGCVKVDTKASREMQWSELGLEQKVERVRRALQMLAQHQAIIGRQAADARRLVHNHEHHPLRGLMEPARDEAANLSGMPHLGYDDGPVDFILRSLD